MKEVILAVVLAVIAILVLLGIFVYALYNRDKKEKYCCDNVKSEYVEKRKNSLSNDDGMLVHNYLEFPIKIICIYRDLKHTKTVHRRVKPEWSAVIPWSKLQLSSGDRLRFLVLMNGKEVRLFKDYLITDPSLTKELHIGMVTSAMLHYMSPTVFGGGSHEIQQLWIHNLGNEPLTFNGHIHVPPKSTIRYDGTGSFAPSGVAIGMTLKNDEGYYADFLIDRKLSDVYYGVVFKESVPLYQGSQYPPYLIPTA